MDPYLVTEDQARAAQIKRSARLRGQIRGSFPVRPPLRKAVGAAPEVAKQSPKGGDPDGSSVQFPAGNTETHHADTALAIDRNPGL